MTIDDFVATLADSAAPPVSPLLKALWLDGKGDWDGAHRVAQDVDDAAGAWVHAYLHRKEGDLSNARYWYRRARQPEATDSLDAEWRRIAAALLVTTAPGRPANSAGPSDTGPPVAPAE